MAIDGEYGYDGTYPTAPDVQLFENENLAVLYGSSTDNEWRALAFQTNLTVRRRERLDDFATLSDGDTLDYGILQEDGHEESPDVTTDPTEDILRIDSNKDETLVEYFISIDPDDVFLGLESPSGVRVTGIQGDRQRTARRPENLDRHGVLSQYTDTEDGTPTSALSVNPHQGVLRVDSEEDGRNPIRLAALNGSGGDATLSATVQGVSYHVTPIDDPGTVEDIVYGDGYNRRLLTWGGPDNTNPNLPGDWKDGRIVIDSQDALDRIHG